MKKSITYLVLLITILVLASCQKGDILRLEQYGYVNSNPKLQGLETSKGTPLCSEELPVKISYVFRNENGTTFLEESGITIESETTVLTDEIRLPVGRYVVEDISLISATQTVTHRVPNSEIQGFNFASFVDRPTPFVIDILPDQETLVDAEVICYTSEILAPGSIVGSTKIVPLKTLYFRIPEGECVDRITIVSDGKEIIDIDISGRGIRGTPIFKEFENMRITAWSGEDVFSFVELTEYVSEGNGNLLVIDFNLDCN